MHKLVLALVALSFAGCATLPGKPDPRDPFERFNRSSFAFNDALDRAVAKPVAKAYKKVTPRVVRTGVSNFVSNLGTITTVVNDVLQGKMKQAGHDSGRFLLNSTLGLGGLFDPASAAGLERNNEDFGQTLGKWGVKSGPYLMLPLLGPSTVRDTVARLPDLRLCVEFRHARWLEGGDCEPTLELLEELGVSFVCVDEPAGSPSSMPPVVAVTSDLAVVRFHGRNTATWEDPEITTAAERFRYRYSTGELLEWVPRIREMAASASQVHVLMNNCYRDDAAVNAAELADLLAGG